MPCEYDVDENAPRFRVKDLEARAYAMAERLRDEGFDIHPVLPHGKNLAKNTWGKAWMLHLAGSDVYGMSLAPGRTLLRHGCLLHMNVEDGKISALVMADRLVEVDVSVAPIDEEKLETLRSICVGNIASWMSLLDGKVTSTVMDMLSADDAGVFPDYTDWDISCTCSDWADLCPHAAAVLYGVGVLLDDHPEILFSLRGITPQMLLPSGADMASPTSSLPVIDLASVFNIELD